MKFKPWLLASITMFVLVNTSYYWEPALEGYGFLLGIALIFTFFLLTGAAIFQFILNCLEKFRNRNRVLAALMMLLISGSVALRPAGLINFEPFSGTDILLAESEGAANCRTVLRLKDNGTFLERTVCFGVSETSGRYRMRGDTVFFSEISLARTAHDFAQFAVIRRTEPYDLIDGRHYIGYLTKYNKREDTVGRSLWLSKDRISGVVAQNP